MGRTSNAKERLLEVAFELLWDNSYNSVSIDQICARAGVNKGSFYYFFKTKADLAVEAYEAHWQQNQPHLDQLFSPQVAPLERLSRWCGFVYKAQKDKHTKTGCVCGCPYATVGIEVATQDEKIRAKMDELISRNLKYLESAIAEAKRAGSANVTNTQAAAERVYSLVLGALLQARVRNDVNLLRNLEPSVMALVGASGVQFG
jgi:TetR/AcrR family transcriptional repressor of nem operon